MSDPVTVPFPGAASWRRDAEELRDVLNRATTQRARRDEFVDGELGWVTFERNAMADAVNRLRARYGKTPAALEQVKRAELTATGHSDYVAKFAYSSADLVHDTGVFA